MKALPRNAILTGDARSVLSGLLAESVDCAITSPPYYRLRRYGNDPAELGREATVDEYVENLRAVFREVARVLKPAGALWLNLGDTYARRAGCGAPPKGLLLAPERLLLALAADGWRCRSKVVWAKRNPLPESVKDRPSRTWEPLYLLTRSPRVFFDLDAIREPHRPRTIRPRPAEHARRYQGGNSGLGNLKATGRIGHPLGKNPGDVWSHATAVDQLGHQATFPEALIERPILATCPEWICVQCDRPWTRAVRVLTVHTNEGPRTVRQVGELKRCDCFAPARRGVVLDPFCGTGTALAVAERLGRDWLGIELNPRYVELAQQRLATIERRAA